ncbi:MAG: hypothetical protein HYX26_10275 [Acidobacteriales bacterium]|nr:hypothetical protein [Terriglobales bacterium]
MRFTLAWNRLALFLAVCMVSTGQEPAHKFAYDKSKEVNLQGAVADVVKQDGCEVGTDSGTHLKLVDAKAPKPAPGTAAETSDIFAGPTWYIKEMGIEIAKDDKVEVIGVWFTQNDAKIFVARMIRKNKDEYLFRDETGAPVWTWLDGNKACKAASPKKN